MRDSLYSLLRKLVQVRAVSKLLSRIELFTLPSYRACMQSSAIPPPACTCCWTAPWTRPTWTRPPPPWWPTRPLPPASSPTCTGLAAGQCSSGGSTTWDGSTQEKDVDITYSSTYFGFGIILSCGNNTFYLQHFFYLKRQQSHLPRLPLTIIHMLIICMICYIFKFHVAFQLLF